jgi:hypothetical protein
MQVNICHRLIKDMIGKGEYFLFNKGGNCYSVITQNIPKGVYATKKYKIG